MAPVFHQAGPDILLKNDAFKARYDGQDNPNIPFIQTLEKAGVDFHVCGQAALARTIAPGMIQPEIQLDLRALTTALAFERAATSSSRREGRAGGGRVLAPPARTRPHLHLPAPARTRPHLHLPAPARTRPHPSAPVTTFYRQLCVPHFVTRRAPAVESKWPITGNPSVPIAIDV